jgi:glycerol-3-phosphate acyltransferase PlsX
VGNIVMKLTEGSGAALARRLTERLEGTLEREAIDALVREVRDLHSVVESHGGGPLLGVNGVSVVGHGRAKADAVSRAIGTAVRVVKIDLTSKVGEQLASLQQKLGSPA